MPLADPEDREPGLLRLYVCGRLAIELGDVLIREGAFPARQGRRLWAWMVLRRLRPAGREEMALAVWGAELPDSWEVALSALVSRLRKTLRPLMVAEQGLQIKGEVGRYELHLPGGCFVDLERARLGLHAAETLLRRGEHQGALPEARVAMEIAGRGFLAGEEAPWIEGVRRELGDITMRALDCTVEAELARGNPQRAEREARYLIGLEPLRESSYRLLMRALAAEGNGAQVRRVLEECEQALRESAATNPSAETVELCRRLTAGG